MSEYTIKPYDESYIEKQVEIGNYFAQKWITYGQSSVDQVKEVYSRDNFDPETRLYCFKGDEMVGYIGATIQDIEEEKIKRAQTRLAFVLPGHEEAFALLCNKLFEVLKRKEVAEIHTPQTKFLDNYIELAEDYGFSKLRTVNEIFIGKTGKMTSMDMDVEASDYNHETDAEELKEMFFKAYENFGREGIENYVNRMVENENLYTKRSIKKDGNLAAFCNAGRMLNEGYGQIQTLIGVDREHKKYAILDVMNKVEKEVDNVVVYLNPSNPLELEEAEDFVSLGFEKVAATDIYEKKL
ncbi:MAG: hypothetical protein KAS47_05290 [Candidatus Heimdallarchaeota archaeon]|nr:hypothetical protein [Candidatus Heimdallarchaeota archaeon]